MYAQPGRVRRKWAMTPTPQRRLIQLAGFGTAVVVAQLMKPEPRSMMSPFALLMFVSSTMTTKGECGAEPVSNMKTAHSRLP